MENNKWVALMQSSIGKKDIQFLSPYANWLHAIILKAEPGSITYQYTVRPEMLNAKQTLHGGVSAGIVDDMCGAVTFTTGEGINFYTTLNNTIDYFAPAFLGDILVAEATIVKNGRQFAHVLCEIWNQDRTKLIVKGTSNLFKVGLIEETI